MMQTAPLVDASKATFDTLFGFGSQTLDGVEQLTALNLQVTKTLLSEISQDAQALLSVTNPDDLVKLQTAAMQAAPQKAASYLRQVQDIVGAATSAQRDTVQAQMAEAQAWFLDTLTSTFKDAPGTENAVALMKSAIVAANKAAEGVHQASRQMGDAVASNIAKLGATA